MRILIEHTVTTPYQPEAPYGGTERFCHQAMLALRAAGHEAVVFVTADTDASIPFTRRSPIPSTLTTAGRLKDDGSKLRTFTDLVGWYASIDEAAHDYDYVILNSAFNSYGLFEDWSFLPKSVLINHFCHPGMIEGEGGLRLQLLGRWLRQAGGRCFSSGASNIADLERRWNRKKERVIAVYQGYIDKVGLDPSIPLFEGWVDVNAIPNDRAPYKKINERKIVAIGRPVKEKQTLQAALAMSALAELGYECHIYTTNIGEDFEAITKVPNIHHHVNVPHADIMAGVVDARCMLFPSKSETNGIVAFEAASHGVPVIYQVDDPDFFLQPSGLGHKFPLAKSSSSVVESLVSMVEVVNQTDEQRLEKRTYFDDAYSDAALAAKLIAIKPTGKKLKARKIDPNAAIYLKVVQQLKVHDTKLAWCMPKGSKGPGEVNFTVGDLNAARTGKSGIYLMLLNQSKDKTVELGDTIDVMIMAWDMPLVKAKLPSSDTRKSWGKWQCLWSAGSHTLIDLGEQDVKALSDLMVTAIKVCYKPLKAVI